MDDRTPGCFFVGPGSVGNTTGMHGGGKKTHNSPLTNPTSPWRLRTVLLVSQSSRGTKDPGVNLYPRLYNAACSRYSWDITSIKIAGVVFRPPQPPCRLQLRPQWKQNHSAEVEASRRRESRRRRRRTASALRRQPGNFISGNRNVQVWEGAREEPGSGAA